MKLFIAVLLALVCAAFALDKLVLDPSIINAVNSNPKAAWVAGENEVFKGKTMSQIRNMLGAFFIDSDVAKTLPNKLSLEAKDVPKEFDSRTQWANCQTIQQIRDQGQCGSCWAFSGAEALSDRFCIKSSGKINFALSPQDMVSCDHSNYGCQGGYLDRLWKYLETTGIVSDKCFPYKSGSGMVPSCITSCVPGSGESFTKYKVKAGTSRTYANIESAQQDIASNGPIQTGFKVYQDFFSYKTGVYHHVSGGFAGGHAVKVVGWGTDQKSGMDYWIVANSWGNRWGQDGYFWILRGKDECGFESDMIAGEAAY